MNRKWLLSIYAAIAVVALGSLYGLAGLVDIDPGYVGLKIKKIGDNKGMQKDTLDTGLQWIEPITYDVAQYDTRKKQYTIEHMSSSTQDGQPITVDISLEIGLLDDKVPLLHEKIGRDYFDQVVYPALRSAVRNSTTTQDSDQIYTGNSRLEVQKNIRATLRKRLDKYGIDTDVNLREIAFTNKDFVKALEDKAKAAQEVVIQERRAAAAEQEAIRTANLAEGQKQKRIKAAEAEKEEIRLRGLGQRLAKEEEAKGNLAIYRAEAEGTRLQVQAYGKGSTYASVKWAENLGPNVKVYGIPTGTPGSTALMDLNGILNGAFKGTSTK